MALTAAGYEYYVYSLLDEEGVIFYVGITNNPHRRMNEHRSQVIIGNRRMLYAKWYSMEKEPVMDIIAKDLSSHEACLLEKYLIKFLGRRDKNLGKLTNHTDGGESTKGFIITDSFREKRRKAMMGSKINVGRKRPDMVKRFSKSVEVISVDGEVLNTYPSQREAAKDLCVSYRSLNRVLKGGRKSLITEKFGRVTFKNLE